MRIRTQNLIAISPLFLGLAAVVGALMYSSAHQEVRWGLEEEATSLSIAIAEFVDGDEVREGAIEGDPAQRFEALSLPFQRLLAHGQVKHIVALDAAGSPIWSVDSDDERTPFIPGPELLRPTETELAELTSGSSAVVSPLIELESGEAVMTSFAPISASDGTLVGLLGVVIDASRLPALSRSLLFNLIRLTLVSLLIGAAAALFVSALLTHKVRALSKAALEVAGGEYDREIQIGTIQELSDLSNTFNTMSSVLKDLIERTQRTLIEGEQFRTPLDLARTYRQDTWQDLDRVVDEVHVASRSIGGGHPGDVFGIVEQKDTLTVYVGRLSENRELDSAIAATAARRAIEEGARHWPLTEVLDQVCQLLQVRLDTVTWSADPDEATLATYDGSGAPKIHKLRLDREQTVLLHTFPGRAGDVLNRWKRVFLKMSPEELVENLSRTLESGAMGTLVAVGREPIAQPVEVS